MRVVLDASAALEITFGRGQASRLATAVAEAGVVLAPDLFVAEVTNAVWKYHRFEDLPLDVCQRSLEAALRLVDTLVPSIEVHAEAFLLARATRRPTYDMSYLALARREDALFMTVDSALRKEAERQGVRVA